MIDEGKPDMVVAFPGGAGTADMVRRAKAADIPVVEIAEFSLQERRGAVDSEETRACEKCNRTVAADLDGCTEWECPLDCCWKCGDRARSVWTCLVECQMTANGAKR